MPLHPLKFFKIFALISCCATQLAIANYNAYAGTEYAVIGDAGRTNDNSKSVRDSIVRNRVSHLILPGDNLYSSTYEKVWAPWKSAALTFDLVAIGNHNGGYNKEVAFFKMPAEYYAKVIEGARFLVLNSDSSSTGSQQAAWLEKQLSQSTESLVFLVYHHPSYTISRFHSWRERSKFQKALRPLIWKYRSKITALLVGHDHLASILHFNDLPMILSGAVQEVRKDKPVNNVQDRVKVQTAWYFNSTPHWAKLKWDSQLSSAEVQFIRAKNDRVACTALLKTGQKAQLQEDCFK